MFKTAEIHFLLSGVSSRYEAALAFHYVSAGQYHNIKPSAVPARSQLSILAKPYLFLFVTLWSHSDNNEERSGSVLWISAL